MITNDNHIKIEENMVFHINLSFMNLKSEKGKTYSLQVSDTVLTTKSDPCVLTEEVSKKVADVSYNMEEGGEEGDEEPNKKSNNHDDLQMELDKEIDLNGRKRTRAAVNQKKQNAQLSDLAKRKEHQLQLLEKKNKEIKERLEIGDFGGTSEKFNKKRVESIKAYNKQENIPPECKKGKIVVDMNNMTVIFPIFGMMIPFSGSLIKSANRSKEGQYDYIRINFHTPISGTSNLSFAELLQSKDQVFIRDLNYKSKDTRHLENIHNSLSVLIKNVKSREKDEKEKADIVDQEGLQANKTGKAIYLDNVAVRPIFGKKQIGKLEAHMNGFRFTSNKTDKIDIIYKNIKQAFYQPSEKEMIIIIHFHLKNPIILAKKKILDIQFTREIGSISDDLGIKARKTEYDEYQMEIQEQLNKERMNKEFLNFVEKVSNFCPSIHFDIPYRDLAFEGVPNKASVVITPTVNCLVNLTEIPFFVMPLENIELVYFERVSQGIRNFDMAIVFQDLSRPVLKISCIPSNYLETVKTWLDSVDILFAEGSRALNWSALITQIKKDPKSFVSDGCWSAIHHEVDSSDDENDEDDEDPSFDAEEVEEEEDDESEYEEDEESEYSDSDVSGGDEDLTEEGMSWDELEEQTRRKEIENVKEEKLKPSQQTHKRKR